VRSVRQPTTGEFTKTGRINGAHHIIGLVVAFESMIGFLQPEHGNVLTIVTTGDYGVANDRVLARIDDGGQIFVSANHWPILPDAAPVPLTRRFHSK